MLLLKSEDKSDLSDNRVDRHGRDFKLQERLWLPKMLAFFSITFDRRA
jgi:hypothetical protein